MPGRNKLVKIDRADECREVATERPPVVGWFLFAAAMPTHIDCDDVTPGQVRDRLVPATRMEAGRVHEQYGRLIIRFAPLEVAQIDVAGADAMFDRFSHQHPRFGTVRHQCPQTP